MRRWFTAPEPPRSGRSGAVAYLVVMAALCACDGAVGRESIEIGGETVSLERGASVHEVRLRATPDGMRFEPDTVRAEPGDVVRFTAADNRGYAPAFDTAALDSANRAFLRRTSQARGSPLVQADAAWIVSLDEAPPGRYPFVCLNHGTGGIIIVSE